MSATDDAGWVRVGDMLQVRRVELSPRYKNLAMFCREREIDYRLAWDVENHARTNYRRGTRTSIELAYGWQPGSIERVLSGAAPVLAGEGSPVAEEIVPLDAFERSVMDADLPYAEKTAAILRHREQIRRQLEELGITQTPALIRRAVRRMGGGDAEPGESRQDARPA